MNSSSQVDTAVPMTVADYAVAIQGMSSGRFTGQLPEEGKRYFAGHYGAPFFALAVLAPELQSLAQVNLLIANPSELLAMDGGRWLSLYSKGQKLFGKVSCTVCAPSRPRSTRPPKPLLFQPHQQVLVKSWAKHLRDLEAPPDIIAAYVPNDIEKIEAMVDELCQLSKGRKVLFSCRTRVEAIIVRFFLRAHGCQTSELLGFDLTEGEPQNFATGGWWLSAVPPEEYHEHLDDDLCRSVRYSYQCFHDFSRDAKNSKDAGWAASLFATRATEQVGDETVRAILVSPVAGIDLDSGRIFLRDEWSEAAEFSWSEKSLRPALVATVPSVNPESLPDEDRFEVIAWLGKALNNEESAETERVAENADSDVDDGREPIQVPPLSPDTKAIVEGAELGTKTQSGVSTPTLSIIDVPPQRSRLSRSAGTVNVLAFAAMLGKPNQRQPQESFDSAKQKLLLWLGGKGFRGLEPSGNQHVELPDGEVSIETDGQAVWSVRFDDRRSMEQGAIWRVEATLLGGDTPAISLRLAQVRSSEEAPPPVASGVPQVIASIAKDVGLQDAGAPLLSNARRLSSKGDLEWLIRLLLNSHRTQPVVVFSGGADTSADRLAVRLTGVAHVVCVDRLVSDGLVRYFGRERSVYGNAVRLYRPGFTAEADAYQHPVWSLKGTQLPKWLSNDLFEETCTISLEVSDLDDRAPSFQMVRSHLAEKRLELSEKRLTSLRQQAESIASSKDEQISQLQAIRGELESAVNEYKSKTHEMAEQLEQLQGELQATRRERDGAIEETRQLRYQLNNQWDDQGSQEAKLVDESYYPDNWEELEDWVEIYGDSKLILLPQAVKAAKDSPFKDIPFAYKAMEYLVRHYIPMKTRDKDDIQPFHDEKQALEKLGLEREPVGSALDNHRYKHEYRRQYDGRTIMLDDHLKWGNGFDPTVIFRLYFHYDEETAKVIIGHMPTHLTNRITHST